MTAVGLKWQKNVWRVSVGTPIHWELFFMSNFYHKTIYPKLVSEHFPAQSCARRDYTCQPMCVCVCVWRGRGGGGGEGARWRKIEGGKLWIAQTYIYMGASKQGQMFCWIPQAIHWCFNMSLVWNSDAETKDNASVICNPYLWKKWSRQYLDFWLTISLTHRPHDIEMTSYLRRCDVKTSHRHPFDVVTTSCACWEII